MGDTAAVCSNIGAKGRRFRRRQGLTQTALGGIFLVAAVGLGASLAWRLVPAVLIGGGTLTWLQAVRSVCVMRAAQSSVEDEEMRVTAADAALAAEAKRVAAGIVRDGVLAGLAAAAVGFATTFVR